MTEAASLQPEAGFPNWSQAGDSQEWEPFRLGSQMQVVMMAVATPNQSGPMRHQGYHSGLWT